MPTQHVYVGMACNGLRHKLSVLLEEWFNLGEPVSPCHP